ncbi:MAG: redoxin domain-containing protein [Opitutales bacterium]|nr:redoxin domain-containing protein [Opitutales bacterium]MCH8540205.1 redoxin domain-containing protein [Opitutales bacterium]
MKKFHLFSTLLLATGLVASAATVGEPAPEFTLTDSNGVEHSLSDFEGQFVILEWINHECPFVVKFYSVGKMQELQQTYTAQGAVWLKINSSAPGKQGHMTPEQANEIAEEKEVNATATLLDHDGEVGRLYSARVTPHMYIINPEGVLVYNGAIDSIRSANSDDIAEAENYVVSAMTAAMAGEEIENPVTQPYGCTVKY